MVQELEGQFFALRRTILPELFKGLHYLASDSFQEILFHLSDIHVGLALVLAIEILGERSKALVAVELCLQVGSNAVQPEFGNVRAQLFHFRFDFAFAFPAAFAEHRSTAGARSRRKQHNIRQRAGAEPTQLAPEVDRVDVGRKYYSIDTQTGPDLIITRRTG